LEIGGGATTPAVRRLRSTDRWPTRRREEVVVEERDTAVAPPPGPPLEPPLGPPPGDNEAADRIGLGMILGIVVLALAGAGLAAWLLTRDDGKDNSATTVVVTSTAQTTTTAPAVAVTVPSLVGKTRAEATAELDRAGFEVNVVAVPGAPPAGRVLAQDPAAGGKLETGQVVRLNVSDGSQGQSTNAQTTAPATTTAPAATTAPATTAPATTAPATTAPATTPQATTQQSTTPAPPQQVQVPSLSGDVKSAVQQLADAQLLASVQYVPGEEPLGTVKAQSPQSGQTVRGNAHVTVSVSSGPGQKEQETVPNVVGQRVNQGVQTVNGANLRLVLLKRSVADKAQAGVIVEQTPKPGAHAPKNAQVVVYMGAYTG
jgi:beta-lactam-binding protein with PASTA domain